MLTLSLFRHAKSSWQDAAIDDFDRPLSERGLQAAPLMAAFMQAQSVRPDLVLCSPARRTRDTLMLVSAAIGNPPVQHPEVLYLAPPPILLSSIRKTENRVRHLMLVGHNPGLQALAVNLTVDADERDFRALAAKFPTAGLAVITFAATSWTEVQPATGRLVQFMTPKRLS